jgi:hypothetical protein
MRCAEVREVLPAYTRDGDIGLQVRRHLSRCEECTSELSRYETLFGSLRSLREHSIEPPPELVHQLSAIPYRKHGVDEVRGHLTRNRNAYAAGLAVAVLGAGAAVWKTRRGRAVTA